MKHYWQVISDLQNPQNICPWMTLRRSNQGHKRRSIPVTAWLLVWNYYINWNTMSLRCMTKTLAFVQNSCPHHIALQKTLSHSIIARNHVQCVLMNHSGSGWGSWSLVRGFTCPRPIWPMYDPYMTYMTHIWPIYDTYMTYMTHIWHIWPIYDPYMTHIWHIWHIYDTYMTHIWHIWHIYDTSMTVHDQYMTYMTYICEQ